MSNLATSVAAHIGLFKNLNWWINEEIHPHHSHTLSNTHQTDTSGSPAMVDGLGLWQNTSMNTRHWPEKWTHGSQHALPPATRFPSILDSFFNYRKHNAVIEKFLDDHEKEQNSHAKLRRSEFPEGRWSDLEYLKQVLNSGSWARNMCEEFFLYQHGLLWHQRRDMYPPTQFANGGASGTIGLTHDEDEIRYDEGSWTPIQEDFLVRRQELAEESLDVEASSTGSETSTITSVKIGHVDEGQKVGEKAVDTGNSNELEAEFVDDVIETPTQASYSVALDESSHTRTSSSTIVERLVDSESDLECDDPLLLNERRYSVDSYYSDSDASFLARASSSSLVPFAPILREGTQWLRGFDEEFVARQFSDDSLEDTSDEVASPESLCEEASECNIPTIPAIPPSPRRSRRPSFMRRFSLPDSIFGRSSQPSPQSAGEGDASSPLTVSFSKSSVRRVRKALKSVKSSLRTLSAP